VRPAFLRTLRVDGMNVELTYKEEGIT